MSLDAVGIRVSLVADPALHLDGDTLVEGGEFGYPVVLESGDLMPRRLDDGLARAVLEGVVGREGEASHLGVADVLDAGIPDDAAEDY